MNENVISMCLKEAVNNIVKHSNATACSIVIESTETDLVARVKDNGTGFVTDARNRGNGLRGMRERLEFVNGSMEFTSGEGLRWCYVYLMCSECRIRRREYDPNCHSRRSAIVAGALASLLDLEEDMQVVGTAGNGKDAVQLVKLHKPDICIMDIEMPMMNGLEAAEELKGSGDDFDNLCPAGVF